jgi:ADP-dependent NAD(P)H-hydrate dehydratase
MPTADPVVVTAATLRAWPLPAHGEDKEARGPLLVVGGSRSTPGAVRLAGEAALRAGAGKLKLATVAGTATALAVAVPESSVHGLPETATGDIDRSAADVVVELADGCDAVLLGPGFVDVDGSVRLLSEVLPRLRGVVVLDALASAYVTEDPERLRDLDGSVVLTVNPNELARTLGVDADSVTGEPLTPTTELARRTGAVVLCGGTSKTVVAPDGRCWVVDVGGSGLGVSGSGDVQSGIVTGLCARGADPAQAAVWGSHLHGRAGERLAAGMGKVGFFARELLPEIPQVLSELA